MILCVNKGRFPLGSGNDSDKREGGRGTLGTSPSCIPLKPRLITTDAGTESGMTLQTLSLPHPASIPRNFLLLFPS